VLLRQYSPEAYGDALALATVVFTGPAHVAAFLKANCRSEESYSSVRIVGIAGSACPPSLVEACESLFPGAVVGQLFGMTETLMALVTPSDSAQHVRHNTVGHVTPEFEIRVADGESKPLASGHEGELQMRGYTVLSSYFGNVDATKQAFTEDGWFRTGDLAKLDGAGNVSLTGRLKDIVNRGGVKFNPADIEVLLESHPSVINAAIVGMPDEIMGERACLFLTLRQGASLCLEDVLTFLHENGIAKLKWPERLVVVAEMPMTPTRKIIKSKLNPQQES
jgi:non-ribosomal peptide synthetase component E (peptide arylation enzyme)